MTPTILFSKEHSNPENENLPATGYLLPAPCYLLSAIMTKSGNRKCVYCGSNESPTIDHVVPISRWREVGVKRRVLDNQSNRVVACRLCNAEKGAMLPQEWFDLHPEYKQRFIKKAKYLSDTVKKIAGL